MTIIIKPQPGYQEKSLSCSADIVFGGGSAGAGKTFNLLLEPMKGFQVPGFRGVIFRRSMPQIKGGGGLWDESVELYENIRGSKPTEGSALWNFKKKSFKGKQKAELRFTHLEHEKTKYDHQGLQYAFIGFDELTHFSKTQFFYLLSRNRSTCGIKPFMRCTCNPDPESWVAGFIKRYLDSDGYIIPERDGVIRYFTIDKDNPVWGNSPEEVIKKCPHIFDSLIEAGEDVKSYIKSFTFIEGCLDENKKLLEKDKTYKANLMAQDEITKHALLHRCWNPVQDDLALVDYKCLDSITSNYLEHNETYNDIRKLTNIGKSKEDIIDILDITEHQYKLYKKIDKYITVDVAGHGKDLAIINVRENFSIVKIKIYKKSDPEDLIEAIEVERKEYKMPKHNVVYDNDGMGWALAGRDYNSFNNGGACLEYNGTKDNYKNLKTQCYYRIIENVINEDMMNITEDNIFVDDVKTDTIKFTVNGESFKVIDLIKGNLKAIKRANIDKEGKKQINTKEEQKNILSGRSPDFGDTIMMRFYFQLTKKKTLSII